MSPEALVLGLLSAARATPLAVVYALLAAPVPRRLLTAYVVAGLVVSLGVGLAVVGYFDGSAASSGSDTGRLIVDLVVGVGAISYASGYASGRVGTRERSPGRASGLLADDGLLGSRLRRPTVPLAALAGAVTNLPGLFYLAGLVAILETQPTAVGGAVQVLVYNALRFAAPLAALALAVWRPDRTRRATEAVQSWAVRHKRVLIVTVFGVVGVYLTAKGLLGLLA